MGNEVLAAVIGAVATVVVAVGTTLVTMYVANRRKREEEVRASIIAEREALTLARNFDSFRGKVEAELTKRREADGAIEFLAKEFHEFKSDIKVAIERLFKRFDDISGQSHPWACEQVGSIASMKTQITTNGHRLDRLERWQLSFTRTTVVDDDSAIRHGDEVTG